VGKKPPQSQKGGSHGLTPWTSAGLSMKQKRKEIFYFLFLFLFLLSSWAQAARRSSARSPASNKQKKKKKKTLFLNFIFSCFGLSPADVRGVKPWEPPF
jgi:hypothetical protein